MRGEYAINHATPHHPWELPPHARRILYFYFTTPSVVWNYLRMRGEYGSGAAVACRHLELPPHARRIPCHPAGRPDETGTTSACAENTRTIESYWAGRNYLRMRGEYCAGMIPVWSAGELPPHARRIPMGMLLADPDGGTTSACAENTLNELGLL